LFFTAKDAKGAKKIHWKNQGKAVADKITAKLKVAQAHFKIPSRPLR
jgi:hypothetical protein